MARLALFVDAGYLNALAEHEFGMWVDHEKLAQEIVQAVQKETAEAVDLFRVYYYDCPPFQSNPPSDDERTRYASRRKFFDALRRIRRFEVREGRLELRGRDSGGSPIFEQKRVDLLLGLDVALLSSKQQISHAALLAGDSDFIPAVDVAKGEGISVWLFHGPKKSKGNGRATYHGDLWLAADERFELDATFMSRAQRVENP